MKPLRDFDCDKRRPLNFFNNGIAIGLGQTPVKKYNVQLRDLIMTGRLKPSQIVSHRLPLANAPNAYAHFDKRGVEDNTEWTKVLLKPELDRRGQARVQ